MQCDKINCSVKDLSTSHPILLMCVIDLPNQLRELKPIKTFLEAITRAARLLHGLLPPTSKGSAASIPGGCSAEALGEMQFHCSSLKLGPETAPCSFPMCFMHRTLWRFFFFLACCLFELRSVSSSYLSAACEWKVVFCCYISCF